MAAEVTPARWIDIGLVAPAELHAVYTGVAYAMGEGAAPVVVWGRARPHLCLGQSQGLCEVAPDIEVPVVRRPLGGGAVWVDEHQYCYALIMPCAAVPRRPADWFAWALAPARCTLAGFGLPARLEGAQHRGGAPAAARSFP
jgi:lipoate-protein ligase A